MVHSRPLGVLGSGSFKAGFCSFKSSKCLGVGLSGRFLLFTEFTAQPMGWVEGAAAWDCGGSWSAMPL